MSESNPPPVDPRLIARVKGILLDPQTEWAVIDDEFATGKQAHRASWRGKGAAWARARVAGVAVAASALQA